MCTKLIKKINLKFCALLAEFSYWNFQQGPKFLAGMGDAHHGGPHYYGQPMIK